MSIDSWLIISVIVFILAVLGASIYSFWMKKASVTDPIIIFLFFFTLFVVPLPLRTCFTKVDVGDVTEHLTSILPYMPFAVLLSAAGLPLFVWSYYSRFAKGLSMKAPIPKTGNHGRRAFLFIAGVSLVLFMALARSYGGIVGFLLLGYHNYEVTSGKGYLWIGLVWLPIATEFLLYNYAVKKKKTDLLLFVFMSVLLVGMFLVLGGRAPIVYFGLTVWFFWHHAIKPVPFRKLVFAAFFVFLGLNLVGTLRESNYESLGQAWQKASGAAQSKLDDSESLFYTLTVGEFAVPFETLPQMIKSVGTDLHPQFGLSYLEAPLLLIPADIFPDRPLGLQNWYMQRFYGDYYIGNENRSFFFLSEGYLNFGPVGVLLTMVIWGLLLGAAHNYIRRARKEPGAVLLYALTLAFVFRGVAGHFGSWISAFSSQAIGIAVIGLWVANGRIFGVFKLRAPASTHADRSKAASAYS